MKFPSFTALAAAFFLPAAAFAQVGSTTDILMGRVTSPDGKPIAGAKIEAYELAGKLVQTYPLPGFGWASMSEPVTATHVFATNFFSCITPQGSSANVLFAGSGYLTPGETYKLGGLVTAANTAVFLVVGSAWIPLVT